MPKGVDKKSLEKGLLFLGKVPRKKYTGKQERKFVDNNSSTPKSFLICTSSGWPSSSVSQGYKDSPKP